MAREMQKRLVSKDMHPVKRSRRGASSPSALVPLNRGEKVLTSRGQPEAETQGISQSGEPPARMRVSGLKRATATQRGVDIFAYLANNVNQGQAARPRGQNAASEIGPSPLEEQRPSW